MITATITVEEFRNRIEAVRAASTSDERNRRLDELLKGDREYRVAICELLAGVRTFDDVERWIGRR